MCNRAVILSTSSAEVLDEEKEVSAGEGAGAFKYRRRKGGKIYGCKFGGIRRGFGTTESGGSGDTDRVLTDEMDVPVETGSRHVGQQVISEDGPVVVLIASDIQVWQYTCPKMEMLTLTVKKPAGCTYRRGGPQVT